MMVFACRQVKVIFQNFRTIVAVKVLVLCDSFFINTVI